MNNENLVNNSNIACPKCGASNMSNTKFCVNCGNQLLQTNPLNSTETIQQNVEPQVNQINQQVNVQSNVQTTYAQSNSTQVNAGNMNYFKYILNAILKPFDSFKKEEKKLSSFKNTGILVAIIIGVLTILNLISTMITSVRVTSYWTDEVEWVWENLKNIQYFKIIGQNLLMYAGVIAAISGVYFLSSLVIKKDSKFVKLLSATTTAFIPLAVSFIISPLLSLIYSYLGSIITIVGFVYFLVILLELLNDQIVIENKNTRIYFHLICLSILLIGGGFIAYKLVLGSLTSGLGSLGSLLG